MSNFSKIVIIILLTLSFFFIKEKWGNNISNLLSSIEGMPKIELPSIKKEVNNFRRFHIIEYQIKICS